MLTVPEDMHIIIRRYCDSRCVLGISTFGGYINNRLPGVRKGDIANLLYRITFRLALPTDVKIIA